jgi:hypothetical protein
VAIGNASVTRAQCDACPQVVYAENGAQPKGVQGTAVEVDGNGRETRAIYFACQAQHIGKAVQNALKVARTRPAVQGSYEPVAVTFPAPSVVPVGPWGASTPDEVEQHALDYDQTDEQTG